MRRYIHRHQPPSSLKTAIIAGAGAMLAVLAIGMTQDLLGLALLFAPLGATCVLVFGLPASPLSQPVNVILGHGLAGLVGAGAQMMMPDAIWMAALAVGLVIVKMNVLRITHPPAGATTLVAYASVQSMFVQASSILCGAVALVLLASVYHRMTGTIYPLHQTHRA